MNRREVVDYIEKNIKGALYREEGELLYELARSCVGKGVIVEIGSLLGKSTAYLGFGSKAGSSIKVYAIDPFDGGDSAPWTGGVFGDTVWKEGYKLKDVITSGEYLSVFQTNMEKAGLSDIILTIPKRSIDAVDLIKEPIELIFIDGAHSYELVKSDFLNYFPKVISGEVIAFHDRDKKGVKQLIKEYILSNDEIEQIKTCKMILYCKKK